MDDDGMIWFWMVGWLASEGGFPGVCGAILSGSMDLAVREEWSPLALREC